MNIRIFNASLLIGWFMATAGGIVLNMGIGLCGGGLLMIALTLAMAKMGGLFVPKDEH